MACQVFAKASLSAAMHVKDCCNRRFTQLRKVLSDNRVSTGVIREYSYTDLSSAAKVWLRSGQAEYHYLCAFQRLDEEKAIDVFRRIIQGKCKIWVYEKNGGIVGFMAMDINLIDRLYIDPPSQGQGVGSAFIEYAKGMYPEGLVLKTHEQNKRARAFYEKRGFKPIRFGLSPPPESMPDVEYCWGSNEET